MGFCLKTKPSSEEELGRDACSVSLCISVSFADTLVSKGGCGQQQKLQGLGHPQKGERFKANLQSQEGTGHFGQLEGKVGKASETSVHGTLSVGYTKKHDHQICPPPLPTGTLSLTPGMHVSQGMTAEGIW